MDRSVCRGFERLCDTWRPTIFSLSHSLILFLSFPPLHLVHKEEKSTRDKVEEPLGPSVSSYLGPSFQSTGPSLLAVIFHELIQYKPTKQNPNKTIKSQNSNKMVIDIVKGNGEIKTKTKQNQAKESSG